jgi:hypothetical protein
MICGDVESVDLDELSDPELLCLERRRSACDKGRWNSEKFQLKRLLQLERGEMLDILCACEPQTNELQEFSDPERGLSRKFEVEIAWDRRILDTYSYPFPSPVCLELSKAEPPPDR